MRRVTSMGTGLVLAAALGRVAPGCGAASFVCESDERGLHPLMRAIVGS